MLFLAALLPACSPPAADSAPASLDEAFSAAARETDVPRDLLVAIAWSTTRLDVGEEGDHEHGGMRGLGVMDLGAGAGSAGPQVARAAARLGVERDALERDDALNILAAATELRWRADALERESGLSLDDAADWAEVVGWYSGSSDGGAQRSFARQVYGVIQDGLSVQAPDGSWIVVEARPVDAPLLSAALMGSTADSSLASNTVWAASCNYGDESRTSSGIDSIVVHTAQGSYSGTYNWFQNCSAGASAHYVIRASDGEITQMVREQDRAWHAGHSDTNGRSVSIELEGYIEKPDTWYTDAMYRSLAALIVDVADRQGVNLDRAAIIGHNQVPGCAYAGGGGKNCHTDPGTGFDWDKLMDLVATESGATSGGSSAGSSGAGSTSGGGSSSGSSGGSTSSGAKTGSGTLVGFVREGSIYAETAGVASATVTLGTGQSALTDSRGYYTITGVAAGATTLQVTAAGFATLSSSAEVASSGTSWKSVAVTASTSGGSSSGGSSSGSSSSGSASSTYSPAEGATVSGESVNMSWSKDGASKYEIKLYFWDGSDWQYYYGWSTTSPSKTVWPAIDDTWYAWSVRGAGDWSEVRSFYYAG